MEQHVNILLFSEEISCSPTAAVGAAYDSATTTNVKKTPHTWRQAWENYTKNAFNLRWIATNVKSNNTAVRIY